MKFKLSDKASRFAKRALADFSERMIVMLSDMPLEEISVQKICKESIMLMQSLAGIDLRQGLHFQYITMILEILNGLIYSG